MIDPVLTERFCASLRLRAESEAADRIEADAIRITTLEETIFGYAQQIEECRTARREQAVRYLELLLENERLRNVRSK